MRPRKRAARPSWTVCAARERPVPTSRPRTVKERRQPLPLLGGSHATFWGGSGAVVRARARVANQPPQAPGCARPAAALSRGRGGQRAVPVRRGLFLSAGYAAQPSPHAPLASAAEGRGRGALQLSALVTRSAGPAPRCARGLPAAAAAPAATPLLEHLSAECSRAASAARTSTVVSSRTSAFAVGARGAALESHFWP